MTMEQEALKMVEVMQGLRENEYVPQESASQENDAKDTIQ